MKKNLIPIALTIGVLFAARFFSSDNSHKDLAPEGRYDITRSHVRSLFPDAGSLELSDEGPWHVVRSAGGRFRGRIIQTSPRSDHIKGYGGPTPLLIAIDPEGTIKAIHVLENQETPAFMRSVKDSALLTSFIGKKTREAVDLDIDAVTGATITSLSVIKTIKHTLSSVYEGEAPVKRYYSYSKETISVLIILAAMIVCLSGPGRLSRLRYLMLGISTLYLGVFRGQLISLQVILSWIKRGVGPPHNAVLFSLALITLLIGAFKGKAFYCYYVCPFGGVQEMAGRVLPGKARISPRVISLLRKLRYFLLVIAVVLALSGMITDLTDLEPFTVFVPASASFTVNSLAIGSIILSFFVTRPWCNFLCPTGAFFEIFRKKNDIAKERRSVFRRR